MRKTLRITLLAIIMMFVSANQPQLFAQDASHMETATDEDSGDWGLLGLLGLVGLFGLKRKKPETVRVDRTP